MAQQARRKVWARLRPPTGHPLVLVLADGWCVVRTDSSRLHLFHHDTLKAVLAYPSTVCSVVAHTDQVFVATDKTVWAIDLSELGEQVASTDTDDDPPVLVAADGTHGHMIIHQSDRPILSLLPRPGGGLYLIGAGEGCHTVHVLAHSNTTWASRPVGSIPTDDTHPHGHMCCVLFVVGQTAARGCVVGIGRGLQTSLFGVGVVVVGAHVLVVGSEGGRVDYCAVGLRGNAVETGMLCRLQEPVVSIVSVGHGEHLVAVGAGGQMAVFTAPSMQHAAPSCRLYDIPGPVVWATAHTQGMLHATPTSLWLTPLSAHGNKRKAVGDDTGDGLPPHVNSEGVGGGSVAAVCPIDGGMVGLWADGHVGLVEVEDSGHGPGRQYELARLLRELGQQAGEQQQMAGRQQAASTLIGQHNRALHALMHQANQNGPGLLSSSISIGYRTLGPAHSHQPCTPTATIHISNPGDLGLTGQWAVVIRVGAAWPGPAPHPTSAVTHTFPMGGLARGGTWEVDVPLEVAGRMLPACVSVSVAYCGPTALHGEDGEEDGLVGAVEVGEHVVDVLGVGEVCMCTPHARRPHGPPVHVGGNGDAVGLLVRMQAETEGTGTQAQTPVSMDLPLADPAMELHVLLSGCAHCGGDRIGANQIGSTCTIVGPDQSRATLHLLADTPRPVLRLTAASLSHAAALHYAITARCPTAFLQPVHEGLMTSLGQLGMGGPQTADRLKDIYVAMRTGIHTTD